MPTYPQLGNGGPVTENMPISPPTATPTTAPAGNNYTIGGTLPWGNGGAGAFQGLGGDPATTLANLGTNYANAYQSSLDMNKANYNNILAGYNQTAQNQRAGEDQTQAGYGQLSSDVLGGISGIGSDQQALINRQYQQQAGTAMQGLISSGLGNSTVTSSVNRGIGLDQALASNNLANSIAQTKAGYQSNIGLAGLNYQGNAVNADSNLAQNQLGWMNSVNAAYPNAASYTSLAQQAGAAQQSNANRALLASLYGQNANLANGLAGSVRPTGGGLAAGTGGRLPPSAVNFGAGASAPGAAGGLSGGGSIGAGTAATNAFPGSPAKTPSAMGSFANSGYGSAGGYNSAAGAAAGGFFGLQPSTQSGNVPDNISPNQLYPQSSYQSYSYGQYQGYNGTSPANQYLGGSSYQSYNYGQYQGGYSGNPSISNSDLYSQPAQMFNPYGSNGGFDPNAFYESGTSGDTGYEGGGEYGGEYGGYY